MTSFTNSTAYISEKFLTGAMTLATGTGSIKERLLDAYRSQVMHGDLPNSEVPTELAERISALHRRMVSGTDAGDDGTIARTVEVMTEDEAVELAEDIFSIHVSLMTDIDQ